MVMQLPVYLEEEVVGYALVDDEDFGFLNRLRWHRAIKRDRTYIYTTLGRQDIPLHKLVYGWIDKRHHVDHINGNTLDNRKENLRPVTIANNLKNRGQTRANTSGFKGVTHSRSGTWKAQIRGDKLAVPIGRYKTLEEAAMAYDCAARILHKEYARLNFPDRYLTGEAEQKVIRAIERAQERLT